MLAHRKRRRGRRRPTEAKRRRRIRNVSRRILRRAAPAQDDSSGSQWGGGAPPPRCWRIESGGEGAAAPLRRGDAEGFMDPFATPLTSAIRRIAVRADEQR